MFLFTAHQALLPLGSRPQYADIFWEARQNGKAKPTLFSIFLKQQMNLSQGSKLFLDLTPWSFCKNITGLYEVTAKLMMCVCQRLLFWRHKEFHFLIVVLEVSHMVCIPIHVPFFCLKTNLFLITVTLVMLEKLRQWEGSVLNDSKTSVSFCGRCQG